MNNKEGLKVEFTKDKENNLSYLIKAVWHKQNESANRFTGSSGSSSYPYKLGVSLIKDLDLEEEELKSRCGSVSYNEEVLEQFTFSKSSYDKKYRLWFEVNNDNRKSDVIKISGEKAEVIYISSDSETESPTKKGKRKERNDSETESPTKKVKRKERNDSETESATKKGKRKIRNDSEEEIESELKRAQKEIESELKRALDDSKKQKQKLAVFQRLIAKVNEEVNEAIQASNEAIHASEKALKFLKKR